MVRERDIRLGSGRVHGVAKLARCGFDALGGAAILWKSAENAGEAAESLGITATRLKTLGLVDKVVNEPLGGAHRDPAESAKNLKKAIQDSLRTLQDLPVDALLERRQDRLVNYGKFKEVAE